VQLTGNIGRGHNDGERLGISTLAGLEVAIFFPHLIDSVLNLLRFIDLRQFSCHNKHSFNKKRPEQNAQDEKISVVPPEFPDSGHSIAITGIPVLPY
jgi:hypothetical protein